MGSRYNGHSATLHDVSRAIGAIGPSDGTDPATVFAVIGRGFVLALLLVGLVVGTGLLPSSLQGAGFTATTLVVAVATPVLLRWALTGSFRSGL